MAKTRIMYIEMKEDDPSDGSAGFSGDARIGRVKFSKTGKSLYYKGRTLERVRGFKYNYQDKETGECFWVSGCKKEGGDRLYGENKPIHIDEDVRIEYWREIRKLPEEVNRKHANI